MCKHTGLGYVRVRSPLLAESLLFSVPLGTEMVHFPELSSWPYVFRPGYGGITRRGFPHSEIPGYNARLQLPEAFRSLLRPSSTSSAKAFTVRP